MWLRSSWNFKRCSSKMSQTTYLVILCHTPEDQNPRPYQVHKQIQSYKEQTGYLNRDTETVCKLEENSWFKARMWQMEWETKYDYILQEGWDSSVNIVTVGWMAQGLNPSGGSDLLHPSSLALGPTQPPVQWVPDLFARGKASRA